jgi:pimeloyl-ACP methyl ester carboxylesterase
MTVGDDQTVVTVFLHGVGRAGISAWPRQHEAADQTWVFLDREAGVDDPRRDAELVIAVIERSVEVVAASYGGLAAMIAADAHPRRVRSLVLCEPACLSIARGMTAVEAHVAALAPVFALAEDPAVSAVVFSRLLAAAMGADPPEVPLVVLEHNVARLRATLPPWTVEVAADLPSRVRTLVFTGGEGGMYDEVAAVLQSNGARHVVLRGHGHRPQDHPQATDLMRAFWRD